MPNLRLGCLPHTKRVANVGQSADAQSQDGLDRVSQPFIYVRPFVWWEVGTELRQCSENECLARCVVILPRRHTVNRAAVDERVIRFGGFVWNETQSECFFLFAALKLFLCRLRHRNISVVTKAILASFIIVAGRHQAN